MSGFIDVLDTLKDTPVPAILVGGGLLFLLLYFVGSVGDKIKIPIDKQLAAGMTGCALMVLGISLYSIPAIYSSGEPIEIDRIRGEHKPIDVVNIMSDGIEHEISVILSSKQPYSVLVEGTFYYTDNFLADAQTAHRENSGSKDPTNWVLINEAKIKATESDFENSRYLYHVFGSGDRLKLRIWDNRYEDNSGGLKASIFEGHLKLRQL